MTPILLMMLFALVVDLFVLLGWSHDSRDGRDWQPRSSSVAMGLGQRLP